MSTNYISAIRIVFYLCSILSSAFWATLYVLYAVYKSNNVAISNCIGNALSTSFYAFIIGGIAFVYLKFKKVDITNSLVLLFFMNLALCAIIIFVDPFGIFGFMMD